MTKADDNIGNTDQQEVIEEGMQGATGNVDANGMDKDMSDKEKADKLSELEDNLGGNERKQ
ncbi:MULTISPECIES: hypothetical protein [Deinococcus]|uniref:Uncharacterized protein n=1 Tax=Deinococcus radiodurans (strain ATCC 13939 / DSM 20539 / JCM 16871 / CCUG 27074 / LMG 4051 / NBRC 15346 / NCIMB 9279 / VKM B-1422 / R1) TaxID=243230 RepID=Q9RW69_DEIRA|nr:hypothetical protein [Deinococcus radiodurans]AAF10380.1 hypothetical protein DR_0800 [Deinococcus radiodurans R1 = ATCC 13939 = DSM 20539]ANC71985.1 hypothetical protein A2G07_09505 [Deinococcus radiodurans R1 = ATCC 13939 = DSM 20539]QEM70312.1 hypothetical protein DXG80_00065 [Deinococcus radiodurans]QIP28928.1 hypothetical protein HAV23_06915 [Deinococcus radiodurans]QIP32363.1 hypothetical protein HAV35_09875 [Deinococcus radiodurans]